MHRPKGRGFTAEMDKHMVLVPTIYIYLIIHFKILTFLKKYTL